MVQENFRQFITPDDMQKSSLCYSDGMGYESNPTFYIERTGFNNYLIMYTISGRLWCSQNCENIAVLSTTEPIFQISESLGFASPSYFSKVFKHIEGISPSDYRNSKNNGNH